MQERCLGSGTSLWHDEGSLLSMIEIRTVWNIGGFVADEDIDFEMPIRSMAESRRKFMEICKSVRLSAG